MKKSITALKSDSRYGLELILCGNAEVLGIDATELPYRRDEAVDMVLEAGGREAAALGYEYSVESTHSRWAGGRLGRGQHFLFASNKVAVQVYRLKSTGDGVTWEYVTGRLPPNVVGEVSAIQSHIEDAMQVKIGRLEKMAKSLGAARPDDE